MKLAVRKDTRCVVCLMEPVRRTTHESALMFHSGYGETRRVTFDTCVCTVRVKTIESVNPRKLTVGC